MGKQARGKNGHWATLPSRGQPSRQIVPCMVELSASSSMYTLAQAPHETCESEEAIQLKGHRPAATTRSRCKW